ncbi:MAG: hypothetical protein ABW224_17370 [Kibdelosporangium sp.]
MDEVRNEISGMVSGPVVQAGRIDRLVLAGPDSAPWRVESRPVEAWDPVAMGVHRAIGGQDKPPQFVQRTHDREILAALESRRPVLLVVRGSSSVGKTRSAFEAVRRLAGWELVFPPDAAALVQVLRDARPNTVVWLDELHTYLEGADSERAAAGLRALLGSTQSVVIVGTIWPEYWHQYALAPTPPERDEFGQARALLNLALCVDVPDTFTPDELARARGAMGADKVLRDAVEASGDGKLTQTLAAARDLVDRYEHAPKPFARAVLSAAVDAVAVGHRSPLPPALLAEAAAAYLDDRHRADPPEDWLAAGLRYATSVLRGAIAALTPVRLQPGLGPADGYLLADYLAQYGRKDLSGRRLPAGLWQALVRHSADAADWHRIGSAARARAYNKIAADCLAKAAAAGDFKAALSLVDAGVDVDQVELWQPIAEQGHTQAMRFVARELDRAGLTGQGEVWRRRAAEAGNTVAMRGVAKRLAKRGEIDEAMTWWHRAADAGDLVACRELAGRLANTSPQDASLWWAKGAEGGDLPSMRTYAAYLASSGRSTEADSLWRRAAARGDIVAIQHLADIALREDGIAAAIELWRRPAEAGNLRAIRRYAKLLEQAGRREQVVQQWHARIRQWDSNAVRRLVLLLLALEEKGQAAQVFVASVKAGNGTVAWWLDGSLDVPAEQAAQMLTELRPLAASGDQQAVRALAWALDLNGNTEEAINLLTDSIHSGMPDAVAPLKRLLRRAGRAEEARLVQVSGLEP